MIPLWVKNRGEQITDSATFRWLAQDAGSGAVDLTLIKGSGSATFTRAGATATTVLSTGLVSSAIAANTARSYYDPAPVGGQGSYMYLPGVSGAYASTPDSTAVSITGDIDVRVFALLPDWTPTATHMLVSKANSVGSQFAYDFFCDTNGFLNFRTSPDGTAGGSLQTATSSVATGISDNTAKWVRATRSSTSGSVVFYTSDDGSSWTQLGTTQSTVAGGIFDSNTVLAVGIQANGTSNPSTGRIYRAQLYNGINGTLVADFDPTRTTQAATSFSGSTGETWTINGRGFIYAAPLYLGYLAEEARTNLCIRSEEFGNAAWTKAGVTATANADVSPDGNTTADRLVETATGPGGHFASSTAMTITAGNTVTVSMFVKQGNIATCEMYLRNGATSRYAGQKFTFSGATIGAATSASVGYAVTSSGVQSFPNGWYRIWMVVTTVTDTSVIIDVYPKDSTSYVGNTANYTSFWGVQAEVGAFATSYIPTAAATSTRAADVMTFASAGNVSSTAGTAFARATKFVDSSTAQTLINAGGAGEYPMSTGGSTNSVAIFDGTNVAASGATFTVTSTFKVASVWGSNIKISLNATFGSSNSFDGSMGFGANIGIGARTAGDQQFNGCLRDIRIWQRVLSDSEVQAL